MIKPQRRVLHGASALAVFLCSSRPRVLHRPCGPLLHGWTLILGFESGLPWQEGEMTERNLRIRLRLQGRGLELLPSVVPNKHSARIIRQAAVTSKLLLYTLTYIVYSEIFVLTPHGLSKYIL